LPKNKTKSIIGIHMLGLDVDNWTTLVHTCNKQQKDNIFKIKEEKKAPSWKETHGNILLAMLGILQSHGQLIPKVRFYIYP
jgi:hypothetical protein